MRQRRLALPSFFMISFFGISIHLYGLLLGIGIGSAYAVSMYIAQHREEGKLTLHIERASLYLIVAGIVGARALFVLYHLDYFSSHLSEIVMFWRGGWVWHGGLIGGALVLFLYCRRHVISFGEVADILVPGVALAQAIGRWGNFFNQEAYGAPTTLPWGIYIDESHRLIGYEAFSRFHPTFLYESLGDLLLFFVLSWMVRRDGNARGYVVLTYLIGYSLLRFFIEFLRIDEVPLFWGLRAPQWVSIGLIVISATLLSIKKKRGIVGT